MHLITITALTEAIILSSKYCRIGSPVVNREDGG